MFVDARDSVVIDVDELGDDERRGRARPPVEVRGDVVGELLEQARGDDLLLGGERTARAVGDGATRRRNSARSNGPASPRVVAANSSAMRSPSSLHGVHCPHDSTARNRATPAATATRSSESSKTMKPAEPRPLPIAASAS